LYSIAYPLGYPGGGTRLIEVNTMPQETPWYRKTLAELLPSVDTTGWSDTAKRLVAPIDSYLMWSKLRTTPGGEELYRKTPGPVAPLLI
jgi:hypothetical protein